MIDARVLIGLPIKFKDKFEVFPPTVREVLSDRHFNNFTALLLRSQEDIDDLYANDEKMKGQKMPTPWQFLLYSCATSLQLRAIINHGFEFFTHQKAFILPEKEVILIGDIQQILADKNFDNATLIKEEDYFELQNIFRMVLGQKTVEAPNPKEHPRIREMKARARYRDRIKAKKGKGITLTTSLVALCCMNLGINPLNLGEIGYASISTLVSMYQQKEKYETDVRSLQAGADPKKLKPTYWITNIDD